MNLQKRMKFSTARWAIWRIGILFILGGAVSCSGRAPQQEDPMQTETLKPTHTSAAPAAEPAVSTAVESATFALG